MLLVPMRTFSERKIDPFRTGARHGKLLQGGTVDSTVPSSRALAARSRAAGRWYVYLIVCRGGAIYTGIARNVAARYAQHAAGIGARYTRANPPLQLLARFACSNQSIASRMEAAIKRLPTSAKRKLTGMSGVAARKMLLG